MNAMKYFNQVKSGQVGEGHFALDRLYLQVFYAPLLVNLPLVYTCYLK